MFKVNLQCPNKDCGKPLENKEHLVSNVSSIHLKVSKNGKESDIYLSSVYGDYNYTEAEGLEIYKGDVLEFRCPYCHEKLPVLEKCSCGADILELKLIDGGMLKFCSRSGCNYHNLSFENSEDLFDFLDKSGYKEKK